MQIFIRTDLIIAGYDEDGCAFTGEHHYIVAEMANGKRFQAPYSFADEDYAFAEVSAAQADAVDVAGWDSIEPCYGSPASASYNYSALAAWV